MGLFHKQKSREIELNESVWGLPVKELQLKEYAINVCAGYISRIFSQSTFMIRDNRWNYRFNIKPNENQSGAEFWRSVITTLVKEGEALVILTDNNMLLLADTFVENSYDLYPNTYSNVAVGNYTFNRTFNAKDVFHFRMNNERLSLFTSSIYDDYSDLISNIFMSSKISNQLRFKMKLARSNMSKKEEGLEKQLSEKYINEIATKAIIALPVNDSIDYEEINSPNKQSLSISSLDESLWSYVDKVAIMLGIPPILLHGEIAGSSDAQRLFHENCLEPLNQLIEDEINSKIFAEKNYASDDSLDILGPNKPNLFSMAESIDKLISSGAFNRNEIRSLLGYDPVDGLDEFLITKNYETNLSELKGGEEGE